MTPSPRLARLFLRPPRPLMSLLLGAPVVVDDQVLDRKVQWLLALDRRLPTPGLTDGKDVATVRRNFQSSAVLLAPRPKHRRTEDRTLPGPLGPVGIRLYHPPGPATDRPVLVFFHGGGWVIGDLDTHDGVCAALAEAAACLVVSADYRRAPEHPYPAPLEDAWAAFQWVREHAHELGGDPSRIAVGGDSAGGNLSAVVARRARDSALDGPCLQLLIYPGCDLTRTGGSLDTFAEGYLLTRKDIRWFKDHYCPPERRADPDASPLLADDLSGLAPACVLTAGYDPLRDEGRAYASGLQEAGVPTDEHCFPGLPHGFFNLAGAIPAAREGLDYAAQALKAAFAITVKT